MKSSRVRIPGLAALALASLLQPAVLHAAATFIIQNSDSTGSGFNDPTPVAPVGGNTGATLGQQRMIAVQAAANLWGNQLNSTPAITVSASWTALPCSTNGGTLASSGPGSSWNNFTGQPLANHLYPAALANKLFGGDLNPSRSEINVHINVNLGNSNCLSGMHFYLGLDGNHGLDADLITILLHELGHGLGVYTATDETTGAQFGSPSLPYVFDRFLLDTSSGLNWDQMTDAQRVASAVNTGRLVWNGANVKGAVPQVLTPGVPGLTVTSPAAAAGSYAVGLADFGPALSAPGVSAALARVSSADPFLGCAAYDTVQAAAARNRIVLIDRGTCNFTVKVKNAQDASALGVVIADNVSGDPPGGMSGTDGSIFIPSARISQRDGIKLKAALASVNAAATLGVNNALHQGADAQNRVIMYAPNPVEAGSSISHFDISATPNLLMEPLIENDVTHNVTPPYDLTLNLLLDIGWDAGTPPPPSPPLLTAPSSGAASISLSTSLTWSAAGGATSYDVYFGAAPSPSFVANTSATNYQPPALTSGATYFWRVVAKNAAGSTSSATQAFTTVLPEARFFTFSRPDCGKYTLHQWADSSYSCQRYGTLPWLTAGQNWITSVSAAVGPSNQSAKVEFGIGALDTFSRAWGGRSGGANAAITATSDTLTPGGSLRYTLLNPATCPNGVCVQVTDPSVILTGAAFVRISAPDPATLESTFIQEQFSHLRDGGVFDWQLPYLPIYEGAGSANGSPSCWRRRRAGRRKRRRISPELP